MSIFIANSDNSNLCLLSSENEACLEEDDNEVYMHLTAIENLIDDYMEQNFIGEEIVVTMISDYQLNKLRSNASFLREYFQPSKVGEKRFRVLAEIVETLLDDDS